MPILVTSVAERRAWSRKGDSLSDSRASACSRILAGQGAADPGRSTEANAVARSILPLRQLSHEVPIGHPRSPVARVGGACHPAQGNPLGQQHLGKQSSRLGAAPCQRDELVTAASRLERPPKT